MGKALDPGKDEDFPLPRGKTLDRPCNRVLELARLCQFQRRWRVRHVGSPLPLGVLLPDPCMTQRHEGPVADDLEEEGSHAGVPAPFGPALPQREKRLLSDVLGFVQRADELRGIPDGGGPLSLEKQVEILHPNGITLGAPG